MTFRIIYTITQAWRYRAQLKRYILEPDLQLANIRDLTQQYLSVRNIKALILDYDGVLAAHGEPQPRLEDITWLQEFSRAYAPQKIYILSNKPRPDRIAFFKQHLPNITWVIGARKKPYPDGLQQIIALSGLPSAQLLIIDDRLCTGILAAIIAGVQGCWITQPYVNLKHRPIVESGIMLLRWVEYTLIKLLGDT